MGLSVTVRINCISGVVRHQILSGCTEAAPKPWYRFSI